MYPLITYLTARDRSRDMLARSERRRLAGSAVAARSSHGPARSLGPIARQLILGGPSDDCDPRARDSRSFRRYARTR